jgi:hypothetical protein
MAFGSSMIRSIIVQLARSLAGSLTRDHPDPNDRAAPEAVSGAAEYLEEATSMLPDPIPLTFAQAAKLEEIASYFEVVRVLRESWAEATPGAPIYVEELGERGFARVSETGGLIHVRAPEADCDEYDGAAALAAARAVLAAAAPDGTLALTFAQAELILDYETPDRIALVLAERGTAPEAPIWIVSPESGVYWRIDPNGTTTHVPPLEGDYNRYTAAAAFKAAEEVSEDA